MLHLSHLPTRAKLTKGWSARGACKLSRSIGAKLHTEFCFMNKVYLEKSNG